MLFSTLSSIPLIILWPGCTTFVELHTESEKWKEVVKSEKGDGRERNRQAMEEIYKILHLLQLEI